MRRDRAAGQLLQLLAYLAPSGIPRDLIARGQQHRRVPRSVLPRRLRGAARQAQRLDNAIATLTALSLVVADRPGHLRMHPLVQTVLRDRPQSARRTDYWNRAAVFALHNALPLDVEPEHWGVYAELLPHCEAALGHAERSGRQSPGVVKLESVVATYLMVRGDLESAERWERRSLDVLLRRIGDVHPRTLQSMMNLGNILKNRGRLDEARRLEEHVLLVRRWRGQVYLRLFGHEAPSVLAAMHNLANTLHFQGEIEQALDLHRAVLNRREQVLGPDHPVTLMSKTNVALALRESGELPAARQLVEEVLAATRREHDEDDMETLAAKANLALVLRDQGELGDARPLAEAVLDTLIRRVGADHAQVAKAQLNLGNILRLQGDQQRARALLEQATTTYERQLGEHHPNTRRARDALALVS